MKTWTLFRDGEDASCLDDGGMAQRVKTRRPPSGVLLAASARQSRTLSDHSGGAAPSDSRSRADVFLGETLYQTPASFPFSSTRKALRTIPKYFFPYIDFSAHTPYASATAWSSSA